MTIRSPKKYISAGGDGCGPSDKLCGLLALSRSHEGVTRGRPPPSAGGLPDLAQEGSSLAASPQLVTWLSEERERSASGFCDRCIWNGSVFNSPESPTWPPTGVTH